LPRLLPSKPATSKLTEEPKSAVTVTAVRAAAAVRQERDNKGLDSLDAGYPVADEDAVMVTPSARLAYPMAGEDRSGNGELL
jgi:hypothetical protein